MFVFVKKIILMSKCIAKSEVIAWQSRGHGFEPRYLHQETRTILFWIVRVSLFTVYLHT